MTDCQGSSDDYNVPRKPRNDGKHVLRFVSFNVCGIKNVLKYMPWCDNPGFKGMFDILDADVICFQETKLQKRDLVDWMATVKEYDAYFTFPVAKKGYSGVAVYVRQGIRVLKAEQGLTGHLESDDCKGKRYRELDDGQGIGGYPDFLDAKNAIELDCEGRSVILDLGFCVLIGLYCPANRDALRQEFKEAFNEVLDSRIRNLQAMGREVLVVGDLNIAASVLDSAEGRQDLQRKGKIKSLTGDWDEFVQKNAEAIDEWQNSSASRRMFKQWISSGLLIDTCRMFHPKRFGMYTCWNQVIDARPGNFGSRVDYILISGGLKCVGADILPQLYGSDHCPIFADIIVDDDQWMHTPENCQQEPPKLCARNYPQFKNLAKITELFVSYKGGKRAGEELPKDRFDYLDNPPPSRKRRATERQGSLLHFFEPLKDRQSPAADNKAPHMKVPDCETAAIYTVDQTPGNQESLSSSAQDHWANIFGPVQPPRCKVHGEPCKLMRTKKRGANKGREFWVCSR